MTESLGDTWAGRHLLISHRIRQRRADLGLTQKQVVTRLARVGIRTTNRALSSLEHGAGIDVCKLPELAAALDCTVTYLVGLTAEPHRWEPDPTPGRAATRRHPRATTPQVPLPAAVPGFLIIGSGFPEHASRRRPDPGERAD